MDFEIKVNEDRLSSKGKRILELFDSMNGKVDDTVLEVIKRKEYGDSLVKIAKIYADNRELFKWNLLRFSKMAQDLDAQKDILQGAVNYVSDYIEKYFQCSELSQEELAARNYNKKFYIYIPNEWPSAKEHNSHVLKSGKIGCFDYDIVATSKKEHGEEEGMVVLNVMYRYDVTKFLNLAYFPQAGKLDEIAKFVEQVFACTVYSKICEYLKPDLDYHTDKWFDNERKGYNILTELSNGAASITFELPLINLNEGIMEEIRRILVHVFTENWFCS